MSKVKISIQKKRRPTAQIAQLDHLTTFYYDNSSGLETIVPTMESLAVVRLPRLMPADSRVSNTPCCGILQGTQYGNVSACHVVLRKFLYSYSHCSPYNVVAV